MAERVVERTLPREYDLPDLGDLPSRGDEGPYVVILYNDDWHPIDAVIAQLIRATGYAMQRCVEITLEAHHRGRAIAYTGTSEDCERVAGVLRQIRLQVETDKY